MDKKTFLENFQVIADAPNGIQQLRDLILNLAISGKLVPNGLRQDLNKAPDVIGPHEIPTNWNWVRFADLATFSVGRTPATKDASLWTSQDGIDWISISDMQDGEFVLPTKRKVSQKARKQVFKREPWPTGTLLMSFKLTIGKVARVSEPAYFNEAIFAFTTNNSSTDEYLFRVLPVIAKRTTSRSAIKGSTLNGSSIAGMEVPLPPVEEQERIVAKVDELMALCDELEAEKTRRETLHTAARASAIDAISTATKSEELSTAWSRISNNWDAIAGSPSSTEEIRRLILDLAVMGKLVEQRESELPTLEHDELESPFEIPDTWRWKTLPKVTSDLGQQTPNEPFSYIDVSSIDKEKGIISADLAVIQASNAPSRARKRVALGTVIYSTVRPYLRNIAIVDRVIEPPAIASTAFAILNPCEHLDSQFLYLCVRSSYFTTFVESKQKGVAYPAINAGDLAQAPLPLPPLSEQKRIVAKVDELMQICDELEVQLIARTKIESAFAHASSQLLTI